MQIPGPHPQTYGISTFLRISNSSDRAFNMHQGDNETKRQNHLRATG